MIPFPVPTPLPDSASSYLGLHLLGEILDPLMTNSLASGSMLALPFVVRFLLFSAASSCAPSVANYAGG